jgi:hypothetical protein
MANKRRRKQRAAGPPPVKPSPVVADERVPPRRGTGRDERPQPLWGSFPLSEIVIAIGLVMLIVGLFLPPDRGKIVVAVGLVLASLAGLEVAVREHFTGYRSHTSLLAGGTGVAAIAIVLAVGRQNLPIWVALVIGLGAGGLAAFGLLRAFRRRSGGAAVRLR